MIIQSAAVLEAVKARPGNAGVRLYGGATADLDSLCARRRPKSRSGRKKACGAVEQKKARKKAACTAVWALTTSRSYKVFGRRHPRCQTRAPAAGVRKAPRHEIAVGDRRRCRNYGDFAAGSGVDVVERGGEMGNFAARHVRELNCERVTDRLCNAILRF
jgi:hypothetical protein